MTPSDPTFGQKSDKKTDAQLRVQNLEVVPTEQRDNVQPNNCTAETQMGVSEGAQLLTTHNNKKATTPRKRKT